MTQIEKNNYRENIGIKEYVVGYTREYEYTVPEVVYNMEGYLVVPDKNGFTWYESYDEQYN